MKRTRINGLVAMWGAPLVIGLIVAAGLTAALVLDGPLAQASVCVALAVPLAAIGYFVMRSARRQR